MKVFGLALALAIHASALAQGTDIAAVARLQGEARTKALVDGARREGEVMVYHSTQTEDLKPVFDAFTAKYGVKVRDWRSSSENVVQRVISETRAGKREVDFIENNSPEMEALRREKMLLRMESPHFADLRPGTLQAHREYATSTMDVFVQAYNTEKVKKEELPRTFADLADPRWKGRLGIEAEDHAWYGTLLNDIGEARGNKLWADVVATNGISVRKGHTLLAQLVVSGEIPLALTVYNYKAEQLKEKGAPIDWMSIGTPIARANGVGMARAAPNPHSAVLFYDFEISEEGQKILAGRDFVPTSTLVASAFGKTGLRFVDSGKMLDDGDKWSKLYAELFGGR